ncbi:HypC/HybG/HupF family hydrogenase formation chaperone [Cyanobacterium sp. uoEpiScrs1]|uniref:HypC/HybG/HupF family hydrogenase formation chaperone n=1 Tax=Cyanobacterium sp. uoEpiScrs1 TaxID=2976343 RepID=UPI00226A5B39|nr:HypC/HybG/HupF family hydrogenase formation chaperone [Cyanobacterium sp. uoEpiScrs1]
MCLAVPGKVLNITGDKPLMKKGRVSFGGIIKEVSLAYVPDVKVGSYVIVHVGFALSILDEEAAQKSLAEFKEMEKILQSNNDNNL